MSRVSISTLTRDITQFLSQCAEPQNLTYILLKHLLVYKVMRDWDNNYLGALRLAIISWSHVFM